MRILSTFLFCLSSQSMIVYMFICVVKNTYVRGNLFKLFSFSCLFVTISVLLLGQAIVTFTESGGLLSRGWSSWSGWKSSRVWSVDLIFLCVVYLSLSWEESFYFQEKKMLSTGSSFIAMFGIVRWTISQLMHEISFLEINNICVFFSKIGKFYVRIQKLRT